jgi:hypothetical protein
MKKLSPRSLTLWRSLFLSVETVVVVVFLSCVIAERHFGLIVHLGSDALEIIVGMACSALCLFLLIGSPFFFRSLRWVAWAGWLIPVGLFVWGLFTPVT